MNAPALVLAGIAVLLWSTLALLDHLLRQHDPLLIAGLGLLIGSSLTAPLWRRWLVPPRTWLVGCGGILGYHLLYFQALTAADPVPVNLVNYLWPLLMVLLAPLVLGGRWRAGPLLGVLSGLAGLVVLLLPTASLASTRGSLVGLALAAAAALVWALYSLLTVALPRFDSAAVGGFCCVGGLGALALCWARSGSGAMAVEVSLLEPREWLLLLAIGVGPLGFAFLCWDAALKRGDPRSVAGLSYLAPLLSTCWLLLWQGRAFAPRIWCAVALISLGAAIAGRSRQAARAEA